MAEKSLYTTQDSSIPPEYLNDEGDVVVTTEDRKERMDALLEDHYDLPKMLDCDREELLQELQQQFRRAQDSRPDSKWELRYKQWRATIQWRDDGKANVNLPIEYAVIENFLADFFSQRSVIQLDPTSSKDIHKLNVLRRIWDYVWVEADTEKEFMEGGLAAGIIGTSWWYEGVKKEIKVKRKATNISKEGKVEDKIVKEERSWLRGEAIDPRYVWGDPTARWEDASYVFWQEIDLSYEDVFALQFDPNFDAEQVLAYLKAQNDKSPTMAAEQGAAFTTKEEEYSGNKHKYSLLHYFNRDNGMYTVVDPQFKFILRDGASPFAHGELPLTPMALFPNFQSYYGRSVCELLENTKYERNVMRNIMIDYVHNSSTINLAVGEGVQFEQIQSINDTVNQMQFRGKLAGNLEYIKPPSMGSDIFAVEERLQNDATWITGIDVNSLIGQQTKTAFEAKLQEQTKLKRIYRSLRVMDFFLTTIGRQRLSNIQFFMPSTTGKQLVGDMGGIRKISIPNASIEEKKIYDAKTEEFKMTEDVVDSEGDVAILELTPEYIENSCTIMVTTPSTTPILRELQKQELEDMLQKVLEAAQTPEGQKMLQRFKSDTWLEELFKEKGYDHGRFFEKEDSSEKKKDLLQKDMEQLPLPPQFNVGGAQEENPMAKRATIGQQLMQQQAQ